METAESDHYWDVHQTLTDRRHAMIEIFLFIHHNTHSTFSCNVHCGNIFHFHLNPIYIHFLVYSSVYFDFRFSFLFRFAFNSATIHILLYIFRPFCGGEFSYLFVRLSRRLQSKARVVVT
jgi:hypothetical protein